MKKVTIIGAGLSGLLAAYRLEQKGYTIRIIEARNRVGGRVYTKTLSSGTSVEAGATWFGVQHIELIALLEELKIAYYPQFMNGKAYFEAFSIAPPQVINLPQESPSYRIKGGTSALIKELENQLVNSELILDSPVISIGYKNGEFHLDTKTTSYQTDYLISTVPPALLFESIRFTSQLPLNIESIAKQTQTWMQESIKASFSYPNAFWRDRGFSGTLFSNVGPITEFYDHCDSEVQKFSLCGFVKPSYLSMKENDRKASIINQLKKTFGEKAGSFIEYDETLWSLEKYTYSEINADLFPHQNNGHPALQESIFDGKFFLAGTETSNKFGGYMEGAVQRINALMRMF